MSRLSFVSPYRLSDNGNGTHSTNPLMASMPIDLNDIFSDITRDDATLAAAYAVQRYNTATDQGFMNQAFPGNFPSNDIARYSTKDEKWGVVELPGSFKDKLRKLTNDPAELTLICELNRMIGRIQNGLSNPAYTGEYRGASLPAERLLFLQAGIGSGKSTMLQHLSRIVFPKIPSLGVNIPEFVFAIVDFNIIAGNSDNIEDLWVKTLKQARNSLESFSKLTTSSDWESIAQPELVDNQGNYLPAIALDQNPEETKRRIIHRSTDDATYIRRVARHLFKGHPQKIVSIVIDNLDIQDGAQRQLSVVQRLIQLLSEIPELLGLVVLREYTLGNLLNMKAFHAYMHINRMHITTPLIGEMLQKRFDYALKRLPDSNLNIERIRIGERISFGTLDIKEIFKRIKSVFDERPRRKYGETTTQHQMLTRSPSVFLQYVTNSNARLSLQLVLEAVKSWALRHEDIVRLYVWQRGYSSKQIELPSFSVDELIRLSAIGCRTYYDQNYCPYIFNVFSFRHRKPNVEAGRFPLLIIYRMTQYFDAHTKTSLAQFFQDFSCFGYNKSDLSDAITLLMEAGFIESPDGTNLSNIKYFFPTRKNWYYVHRLSKMLVYLEHIKNDSIIEYRTQPCEVRVKLHDGVKHVLEFISYIMTQEIREWKHVRSKGVRYIEKYKKIATIQPVCWKLLRSICERCNELYYSKPEILKEDEWQIIADEIRNQSFDIRNHVSSKDLWPPIPTTSNTLDISFGTELGY